jgi:predicted acyltransferase
MASAGADSIPRVKAGSSNALSGRLESLDVFRGATIAAMMLVNNPGDWATVYWPLLHVPWHGWTPTDLVFPFFLFIVGVALTFSKRATFRDALVRALKLIGLGLLLALYPYFPFLELRWPGVLQRIGICYLAAWAAWRFLGPRALAALAATLLVGYWALMTQVTGPEGLPPNLEKETNLAAQVDRMLLGGHMWAATKTWDPEGLVSTLPAIATPLLGLLCGAWLAGRGARTPFRTTLGLVGGGLVLTALGVLWGEAARAPLLFPINKNLWSPSFVLFTGGLAWACLGVAYAIVDVAGVRRWAAPLVTYGRNPIAVYVVAGLVEDTWSAVKWSGADGTVLSLKERLYHLFPASVLPPYAASLAWALMMVALYYLIAAWLDRRGIYLKV